MLTTKTMRSLLGFGVFLSNILGIVCVSYGNFIRINGYKLSGAFTNWNLEEKNTRIKCAKTCLQNTTCLSINYHSQTEECQLNTDSPYTNTGAVQEANGWAIYHLQRDNDWELVFRASANNSISPYQAWMGTFYLPTSVEAGCRLMTDTFTCTTIYRGDVLDRWDSENITEVKLELYKGGSRVVNIRFNGTGTTYTNWFDNNRLMDSGWSTLSQNRSFNYFSVIGEGVRRFFINQNYGGCPNDAGWMVIIDVYSLIGACDWDSKSERPAFLFAPGEDVTTWNNHVDGTSEARRNSHYSKRVEAKLEERYVEDMILITAANAFEILILEAVVCYLVCILFPCFFLKGKPFLEPTI